MDDESNSERHIEIIDLSSSSDEEVSNVEDANENISAHNTSALETKNSYNFSSASDGFPPENETIISIKPASISGHPSNGKSLPQSWSISLLPPSFTIPQSTTNVLREISTLSDAGTTNNVNVMPSKQLPSKPIIHPKQLVICSRELYSKLTLVPAVQNSNSKASTSLPNAVNTIQCKPTNSARDTNSQMINTSQSMGVISMIHENNPYINEKISKSVEISKRRKTISTFSSQFRIEQSLNIPKKEENVNLSSNRTSSITALTSSQIHGTSTVVPLPVTNNLSRTSIGGLVLNARSFSLSTTVPSKSTSVTSASETVLIEQVFPIVTLGPSTKPTSIGTSSLVRKSQLLPLPTEAPIQPETLIAAKKYIKDQLLASLDSSLNTNRTPLTQGQLTSSSITNAALCVPTTSEPKMQIRLVPRTTTLLSGHTNCSSIKSLSTQITSETITSSWGITTAQPSLSTSEITATTSRLMKTFSSTKTLLPLARIKLLSSSDNIGSILSKPIVTSLAKITPPGQMKLSKSTAVTLTSVSSSSELSRYSITTSTSAMTSLSSQPRNIIKSSHLMPSQIATKRFKLAYPNIKFIRKPTNATSTTLSSNTSASSSSTRTTLPMASVMSSLPLTTSQLNTAITTGRLLKRPLPCTVNSSSSLTRLVALIPAKYSNKKNLRFVFPHTSTSYNTISTTSSTSTWSVKTAALSSNSMSRNNSENNLPMLEEETLNANLQEENLLMTIETRNSIGVQCDAEEMDAVYEFLETSENIDPSNKGNGTGNDKLLDFIEKNTLQYENGFVECLKCGEIVKGKSQLQAHIHTHFQSKMLCASCGCFLRYSEKLHEHQCGSDGKLVKKTKKVEVRQKLLRNYLSFHCPYYRCNVMAKCLKSLHKHITEQHISSGQNACTVCDRINYSNPKQHLQHILKQRFSLKHILKEQNSASTVNHSNQILEDDQQHQRESDTNKRILKIKTKTANGKILKYKVQKTVDCLLPQSTKLKDRKMCQICLKIYNDFQFKKHNERCVAWHKQRCLTRQERYQI